MVNRKIVVAMSGGVDSSVAAALLLEQGFEPVGVTLKTFCYAELDAGPKSCCGLEGIDAARAVAGKLGIPHFVYDVSTSFKTEVIDDFIAEYAAGRTPNPCVRCNATVKIPELLRKAQALGCQAIATGHYAKVAEVNGEFSLFRGADKAKDQAYFLWELPADILPHLLLPLGDLTKPQVRHLAKKFGFTNADKPESQEICFIPNGDYVSFLRKFLPTNHPAFARGRIIDEKGNVIGAHDGYVAFTIGQRKGIGGGHGRKLFVVSIDPATKQIRVGEEPELWGYRLKIDKLNKFTDSLKPESEVLVQIRHRATAVPAKIAAIEPDRCDLILPQPAKSITTGQSAVLFHDERIVAGGRIVERN